jgi:hypothetical protein
LRLALPEGEHAIIAHIDWARSDSLTIHIRAAALTTVEVGSNVTGWRLLAALYFATFERSRYLYIRQRAVGFSCVFPHETPPDAK